MNPRLVGICAGAILVLAACSSDRESQQPEPTSATSDASSPSSSVTTPDTEPPTTDRATTTVERSTTTVERSTTTTARPTTTTSSTTTPSTTTTTTTAPPLPVHNPPCVVQVQSGDSLSLIADGVADEAVSVASLQLENGIADPNTIRAGAYLDICPGNDIDDITGAERLAPPPPPAAAAAGGSGVQAQQQKLNELFAGYGLPALAVDGDSGRLTEQQLCAARVALGLPINRADMAPGSSEEQALMAAGALPVPAGAPVSAPRWALIDQTCQIMFVGEGSSRVVFVFPTSTGEPGHETRDQNGSRVFRYDPARDNGGWHDSSVYPVGEDNPLNGNMYLPLYFDNGQAIHGANNVPPEPRSKGCARLRVENQDALIDWLGLRDVAERIWDTGRINLAVSVQGRF